MLPIELYHTHDECRGLRTHKSLPKVADSSKILQFCENLMWQLRSSILGDIWSYLMKAHNFPKLPENVLAKISEMAYSPCVFRRGKIAKLAVLDMNNDKQQM